MVDAEGPAQPADPFCDVSDLLVQTELLVETADGVHIRCVVAPRQREFVFFSDGNSEHRRHVVGAFDDCAFFHFCLVFGD